MRFKIHYKKYLKLFLRHISDRYNEPEDETITTRFHGEMNLMILNDQFNGSTFFSLDLN